MQTADLQEYFQAITRHLQAGSHFAVESHNCTRVESENLIMSLVPIAVKLQDEAMLSVLSHCYFPGVGKDDIRTMFVEHYANW